MNRRALRQLVVLGGIIGALLMAGPLWADGGADNGPQDPTVQPAEIFAPRLGEQQTNIAPSPFTLLTPIRQMLSGPLWLMAMDADARQPFGGGLSHSGLAPRPGFAWQNMKEIFVAPPVPATSAPQAPSGQLVPFRDPAPAFSRDILVTRDFSNSPLQTEPHLAVNPNDPDHLIMGTVDYNFPNVSAYVSIDGGATWEGPHQPQFLREDAGAGGDPIVGFDREGNAYLGFISIGVEEFTVGPAVDAAVVSSIAISRSTDGGFTWEEPVSSARSGFERDLEADRTGRARGRVSLSFLDKPWLAIGPHPTKPDLDVIYVTYTKFTERFGLFYFGELPFYGVPVVDTVIEIVWSEDGGKSWSEPVKVSPTVRRTFGDLPDSDEEGTSLAEDTVLQENGDEDEAVGTRRVVQGSQPAVAPDGTLYVAWMDSTNDEAFEGLAEVYVARSEDGGLTFTDPVRTSVFNEPGFSPRTGFFRYWASTFPQLAAGPNGEVYVAYTAIPSDRREDDGDIYLVRSLDRGETWDRPLRLNDDDTDRLQFFPSITVDPNGAVHAMWGDMRDDRADTRYHIYYSRSEDQAESWGFTDEETGFHAQNARVTDFPSNPNKGFPGGLFIGDYFSIKATAEDVYMVWADTRLGEFGPVNQKIGFSRRQAIPSPEVFISPPAGPGGQAVTLQGFNFQPDIDLFVQVGGVLVSTERTNDQGRFTTQVFIPISGEGAHDVTIFDDSGNFATASFFMEFGFDNVQDIQASLEGQVRSLQQGLETVEGDISTALSEEVQRIRDTVQQAVMTLPPPTDAQQPEAVEDEDEGLPWWVLALGVGLATLAGSAVTLVIMRMSGSRGGPTPPTWQPMS